MNNSKMQKLTDQDLWRNYVNGQRDFVKIEIVRANLFEVDLRNIQLLSKSIN
ncbi:hypothetical protein AB3M80_17885 [Arthrospira platensis BEA 1257B]